MATERDEAAAKLYADIMEEVKLRAFSINTIRNVSIDIHPHLITEYCFLQLRMLCELVALGCLVAHGDIEETQSKEFQKIWKADEIIKRLELLHPNFFPVPVSIEFPSKGHVHLAEFKQEYLTKAELVALYGRCGDVLHKGSMKQLISPKAKPDLTDVQRWGQKALNLLSQHKISRIDSTFHIITVLSAPQVNGNVLVNLAELP